jgi:signal transduction histidine kinase
MNLRTRFVLTLLAITTVLLVPAVSALFGLRELQNVAAQLRTRDTEATRILGRINTGLEELDYAHSNHVVLWNISPDTALYWRARTDTATRRLEGEIRGLGARPRATPDYRAATDRAARQFEQLRRAIAEEQSRLRRGVADPNSEFRQSVVVPAFDAMENSLEPVAQAIARESDEKVQRAQEIADRAATTTLTALAAALIATLLLGAWLTRGVLRPVSELRAGMGQVAEGDFNPDVRVPTHRPDEIGELARSFTSMAERLAELDRLKAEFVSVASHEIKTPLSVIRGYVSLLADGIYGEVNETQRKTLGAVNDQTDRLTRLVHRLLDISRFEAGGGRLELRRINVRDFLQELASGFQVLAYQNGIDFPVEVADDLPVNVVGDSDRLNEVLGNLLSNAFKFTRRGGTIRLEAHRDGAGIRVTVADTGVGIPADKLPHIFEKFYQVDNDAQPRSVGSGLGLAIAREIVEAHGGTISAASEEGEGTTFTVVIPERPPAAKAGETIPHG